MIDLTFARMANMPAREIKAKKYSKMLHKKKVEIIEHACCILTGIIIAIFLILINYI